MKDFYVQAVVANLEAGMNPETVLRNLKTVLERRGHLRLYGEVLKQVQKTLEQKQKSKAVTVIVSTEKASHTTTVQKLIDELGADTAEQVVIVDPTIIGGAKVIYQDRQLDATHKTALYSLYQSITK
jgi:F0F1-type ATP synthase delta subunit